MLLLKPWEEVRGGQGQSQILCLPDPPSGPHYKFILTLRGSKKKGARTQYFSDGVPSGSCLDSCLLQSRCFAFVYAIVFADPEGRLSMSFDHLSSEHHISCSTVRANVTEDSSGWPSELGEEHESAC